MKNLSLLPHSEKLSKDALVTKAHGITHLDNPSLYISCGEDILIMIQAADAFFRNNHKPTPYHVNFIHRHAKAVLDKLHVGGLNKDWKKFPTFALFIDTKLQQTKIIFYFMMSLSLNTEFFSDYNARDKPKKWNAKAGM